MEAVEKKDLPLDVEQKHAYVRSWLEGLFPGEDGVPDYEINSHTIDVLYQMALRCERRERSAKVMTEDMEQKAEEYASETARLQSVTEWLGFSTKELPSATQNSLKVLAGVADALEIKDCSDTSYCLALSDLCERRAKDEVERGQLTRDIEREQEEIRRALVKQANQRRVLGEASEEMKSKVPLLAKQKKESEFLKQKSGHYQKLVTTMTEELKGIGYEPSLSHTTLLHLEKEVEELQSQLAPLKEQLASYQDLPPDLDLARVKVESARRELGRLESELAKTIDLVHVEK